MNATQKMRKAKSQRKPARFQTTLFDLVRELSRLTQDDKLVVAAVKDIINSYRVRFEPSLAPVKLVATARPVKASVPANCRSTRLLYS